MKKIIMVVAAIAVVTGLFAVDFAASVTLKGELVTGKHTKEQSDLGFLGMDDNAQKDTDLLQVHFSGDKAGADFQFYTGSSSGEDIALSVRSIDVWFKPIDMLTVKLGNVSQGLYTERLTYWKVPAGGSYAQFKSWDHRWSSYATVEGFGMTVDASIPVMSGLSVGAGITPGKGNGISMTFKKDTKVEPSFAAYGVYAKLQITDTLSAGVAWRDEGNSTAKILAAGADFGSYGTPYYGFLQGRFYFDDKSPAGEFGNVRLMGIVVDNYISYNFGFMKIDATLPVVIRGIDKDAREAGDPSYMNARIRVTVPFDAFTFTCKLGTDEGLANGGYHSSAAPAAWVFDKNFGDNFNFYVYPSVSFSVGSCSISAGAEFAFDNAADGKGTLVWGIPFSAQVSF